MAQHGYLREYDEGWDRDDERDRDRDRSWREEERGWRGSDRQPRDRGWPNERGRPGERTGNFMFGERGARGSEGRQRQEYSGAGGDRARSSFRDDDDQYRGTHEDEWGRDSRGSSGYGREHGYGGFQGDYSRSQSNQGGFGGRGDWEGSQRNFSSRQDDHYRSWRDRQMRALDQDYADYCREREQQFHQDFDSWRENRQNRGSSQQQSNKGTKASSEAVMELDTPAARSPEPPAVPSPTAEATLGTNNSENSGIGRGRS